MRTVTILVCGEPLRGDDGVAIAVADGLARSTRSGLEIRRVGSLMPDDVVDVEGPVLVLDAVAGPEPGTFVDLPLAAVAADSTLAPPARSSHALSVPATLGIAARLRDGGLPPGRFLGVAVGRVGIGDELSQEVAAAVPRVVRRAGAWVRALGVRGGLAPCA
jgi:hydrogenase maturation protease